jgi:preprotein translocase subunit SecD
VNKAFKSARVVLLFICVAFSLALITNLIPINPDKGLGFGQGLDYGIDFAGGTQLQLKLETPVSSEIMSVEKSILENRLNSLGLKDIPVQPWGDQYLIVQIAESTPEQTKNIEDILKRQARFEERIDGELAIIGDEVRVDLGPQGAEIFRTPDGGFSWAVLVSHDKEGACRFGKVADGKRGRPVDTYIDRPQNTSIFLSDGDYNLLSNLTDQGEGERFFFGDTALDIIANRSRIPVHRYIIGESADEVVLDELRLSGINRIILAADTGKIPDSFRNELEVEGFRTSRNPLGNRSYIDWVADLVGLQSSPRLDFDPRGECVYNARITGGATTIEAAQKEIQDNQILLSSGNLPAKLTIESKSTTPPTLGKRFLTYSIYTGFLAIAAVAVVIFLRYKRIEILAPIMGAGISEVFLILGFAAFISWELDLPALAGIIAAVGTGVDHQILITDETLRRKGEKKNISIAERLRRAFFIIFTAAATAFAAMIPLMGIGAGMLKGFAFTTMMGIFMGVSLARPAYAKVIEEILKKEE